MFSTSEVFKNHFGDGGVGGGTMGRGRERERACEGEREAAPLCQLQPLTPASPASEFI